MQEKRQPPYVIDIPADELRRAGPFLKKSGDSVVVAGFWAPSEGVEKVSALLVIEWVGEDDFIITPMGVGDVAP